MRQFIIMKYTEYGFPRPSQSFKKFRKIFPRFPLLTKYSNIYVPQKILNIEI